MNSATGLGENKQVRLWRYGLTADEWLHLAAEGEDSEVGPCCGNIGQFRDSLNCLATQQEPTSKMFMFTVMEDYRMCLEGHDMLEDPKQFPLLHRVMEGIKKDLSTCLVP